MASILTDLGKQKLASATPENQLNITNIAVGDGSGGFPPLLPGMTALNNEVWRGQSSSPIRGAIENTLIFEGMIPSNTGGFTVREVGIFDSDGDLIAIGHSAEIEKPETTTGTTVDLTVRMHIALENAETVNLIVQDQGYIDHQGLTNRSSDNAHPATAIDVDELVGLSEPAANLQATLNKLKAASKRDIGTGTDQVPDKEILDARLGTTGNLGDAAQKTIGTGTDQVPDKEILDTRLGTSGSLGDAATRNVGTGTDQIVDKEILDSRFGGYTGNLSTAARFPVGSEPLSIPNNEELNTRLATTGNLGDAAQKTIGTGSDQVPTNGSLGTAAQQDIGSGTDQVPDKEILDSRFGEGDNIMVGAVVYFATTVTPSGYIKANGAAVSRTTYANLFARVGTFWGTGNGSTTFNVPDLRGEFIRTFDDGRGIDSGRSFGSFQAEEFKSHTHPQRGSVVTTGSFTGYQMDLDNTNATVSMNISTDAAGGEETRPRNIALAAYIKY